MFPLATLTAFVCAQDGWCSPPRPIIICQPVIICHPPVMWIPCPPIVSTVGQIQPIKPTEKKAEEKKVEEKKIEQKKPETKPDDKPIIKPVTEITPTTPDVLPKTVTPPDAPKPAPKIEMELPKLPTSKPVENLIPSPTDLPMIPPIVPPGGAPKAPDKLSWSRESGYRPRVNVVTFPGPGSSTEVSLFNLSGKSIMATISGQDVTIPARSRQSLTVSGEVNWKVANGERSVLSIAAGQAEIYFAGE